MISQNLSVVIPCFNEERTILSLLNQVLKQEMVGQVVVVDDGSTDSSQLIIESIKDARIQLIVQHKNQGKGAALSRGLEYVKLDYVVIQDADLEYNPTEYSKLLKPIVEGHADVVYGSRFLTSETRRAVYFWHHLGNSFLTLLSNMATNIDLTDMETCYKMMKLEVAKSLKLEERRFGVEPEITAKIAAFQVAIYEVPISYYGRTYSEGKKIGWKDGFRAIYCIVKYNTRRNRTKSLSFYRNRQK
jgi:glycosyltransferase involved in cell wall biosynthesis